MIELSVLKRDSTKHLIGALSSLQIIDLISANEAIACTEILFKLQAGIQQELWLGIVQRLLLAPNLNIYKKYLLKEGLMVFCWGIQIISEDLDVDIIKVCNYIYNSISKSGHNIQPVTDMPIHKVPPPKIFNSKTKKKITKVIESSTAPKVWSITLPHTKSNRNQPGVREDGSKSSKGAFLYGSKEWSRAASSGGVVHGR